MESLGPATLSSPKVKQISFPVCMVVVLVPILRRKHVPDKSVLVILPVIMAAGCSSVSVKGEDNRMPLPSSPDSELRERCSLVLWLVFFFVRVAARVSTHVCMYIIMYMYV